MAITRFQDLPSTNTPINSANLNGNFDELGAKVGTSIDSNYKTNIIKGINLFDKSSVVNNTRLGTDGSVITDQYTSTLFTTNFIEILPSTQYTTSFTPSNYATRKCFYNSSKTFISYSDSDKTFTTPNNAKYMRFTYSIDNINNVMLVKGSSVPTTYQPYIKPTINVDGEDIYVKGQNEVYSTKEQVIGTWIDKPVYRKVINFGALPNATTKSVSHNISNLGTILDIKGTGTNGSFWFKFPHVVQDTPTNGIEISVSTTLIYIKTGSDRSAYNAYVILEYTKTTD